MLTTHPGLAQFAALFGRMTSRHHIEHALRAVGKQQARQPAWTPQRDASLRNRVAAQTQRHQAQTGRNLAITSPSLALIRGGAR